MLVAGRKGMVTMEKERTVMSSQEPEMINNVRDRVPKLVSGILTKMLNRLGQIRGEICQPLAGIVMAQKSPQEISAALLSISPRGM